MPMEKKLAFDAIMLFFGMRLCMSRRCAALHPHSIATHALWLANVSGLYPSTHHASLLTVYDACFDPV